MEGLGEGSDSTGNIRIAFIEFENWEANTVTELIKAKQDQSLIEDGL